MYESIPYRLLNQANLIPHRPAYYVKESGAWRPTTFRDYVGDVRRAARAMLALGLGPTSTTSILGFNRPEWITLAGATMAIGGAPVGVYTTCSSEEVHYIVNHAESPLALVENAAQLDKIKKEWARLPLLKHVVQMKGAPPSDDPRVMSWADFLAKGDSVPDSRVDELVHAIEPSGLAALIYTSGTTGPPKGVMLSHEGVAWTAATACKMLEIGPEDTLLSYLPLSHIAEQMFSIHIPSSSGYALYFAESIDKLADNLKEVQPTVFFGVPRVWEKFHAGVSQKMAQATGVKKVIAEQALRIGREVSAVRARGGHLSVAQALQYEVANRLVFSKIKPAIGLGRARICVTAAAPISKEILEFFASIDILVREVYGQSEGSGPTTSNQLGRTKLGTVGPALPGVSVKIAEDGEILVKGPNVFMGYYKEPQATAETLIDGWLHSGDLGAFDDEGYLSITGRKKEIIITAGGKNIAPKNIEGALKNDPLISEAVVIGDRRKFLSALITLDQDAAKKFAEDRGISGPVHESAALHQEIQRVVDEVNSTLARVETVKKFHVLPGLFTIDGGELTPSLKIKRRVINEKYAAQIEAMYKE